MCDFSHFHTTLHHPTLLYVTLHFSMLLTLHCWLFSLLYNTFSLCTTLQHHFVYAPECFSPQRKDVEAAGYSSTSEWFEARKHSLFTSCLSSPRILTFGWICPRTVIHPRFHPVLSSRPTCRIPPEAEVGPSMWLEAWPDAVRWECSSEVPAGNARANGCRSKSFRDNCTSAQEENDSRSQKVPRRQRRIGWDRQSQKWS